MPRDRAWIPNEMKGVFDPMKKIFKAMAEHFALYGQRMTENLGL